MKWRAGSSPRTRGTEDAAVIRRIPHRFIPAHAGNRAPSPPATSTPTVHPRARGEQGKGGAELAPVGGSSPRTRGTARRPKNSLSVCRFIPAHAGNSRCAAPKPPPAPVHPRARGEQASVDRRPYSQCGSSPRTRGTGQLHRIAMPTVRFIPAHAGNSRIFMRPPPWASVHPRARGEQVHERAPPDRNSGSSPRTRGTGTSRPAALPTRRFIPAHAGNRSRGSAGPARRPVHPRARGEQLPCPFCGSTEGGSSPRTRGTGWRRLRSTSRARFIPAHAGNRSAARLKAWAMPVHPRARGEQEVWGT